MAVIFRVIVGDTHSISHSPMITPRRRNQCDPLLNTLLIKGPVLLALNLKICSNHKKEIILMKFTCAASFIDMDRPPDQVLRYHNFTSSASLSPTYLKKRLNVLLDKKISWRRDGILTTSQQQVEKKLPPIVARVQNKWEMKMVRQGRA